LPCGHVDTEIIGEVLEVDGEPVGIFEAPFACHCAELCNAWQDEGCVSWRFSNGQCFLQASFWSFSQLTNDSPHSTGRVGATPGWTSGQLDLQARSWSVAEASDGNVPSETVVDLHVHGRLADSAMHQFDGGDAQRVKLVAYEPSSTCNDAVPAQVSGVACELLERTHRTETQADYHERHTHGSEVYTLCAPAPVHASASRATFPIRIARGPVSEFVVCFCMGPDCTASDAFEPLGEILSIAPPPTFGYEVPETVTRGDEFEIVVSRPMFGSFSDANEWVAKVVWSGFGCKADGQLMAETFAPHVAGPDIVVFTASATQAGSFDICVSEHEHAKFLTSDNVTQYPSATDWFIFGEPLRIHLEEQHITGVFHSQLASLESGAFGEFRLQAAGLLPTDTQSRVLLADECGGNTFLNHAFGDSELAGLVTVLGAANSREDALMVSGLLPELPGGMYPVCVCRAGVPANVTRNDTSADLSTITDAWAHTWTYVPAAMHGQCTRMDLDSLDDNLNKHGCMSKCAQVCVGSDCYCEGLEHAEDDALCLTPNECADACSSTKNCAGYELGTGTCYLRTCPDIDVVLSYDTILYANHTEAGFLMVDVDAIESGHDWNVRVQGRTCTSPSDYTQMAGYVTVTERARLGATYVAEVNKITTIEVVASTGDLAGLYGETEDRIIVIDGEGTCGLNKPTRSVRPGWPGWDDLGLDWLDLEPITGQGVVSVANESIWVYREFQYCPGSNIDPNNVPELFEHQCYAKCLREEPCIGEDCYCQGSLPGFDTPDTRALCLPESRCLDLCAGIEDCVGVDMHLTAPRCFLNLREPIQEEGRPKDPPCGQLAHEDLLGNSDFYRLIWKQNDIVDDGDIRTGAGPVYIPKDDSEYERRLTAGIARDLGYSWPRMLRFGPIVARAAGSYQVCMCDSSLRSCKSEKDFTVRIGVLEASGVACVIKDSRFRSDGCESQYHGGLRCGVETPPFPTSPAGAELPPMNDATAVRYELSTIPPNEDMIDAFQLLPSKQLEAGIFKIESLWGICITDTTNQINEIETGPTMCDALRAFYGARDLDKPPYEPHEERLLEQPKEPEIEREVEVATTILEPIAV